MARPSKNINEMRFTFSLPESYYQALNELAKEQDRPLSEVIRGCLEPFILPDILEEKSLMYETSDNYIQELERSVSNAEEASSRLLEIANSGKEAIKELQAMAKTKLKEVTIGENKKT